ncbi:unnamed protein product, partial [Prorocentrum cordatum]
RWPGAAATAAACAPLVLGAAAGARRRRSGGGGRPSVAVRVATAGAPSARAEETAFSWRSYGADWEVHKFGGASLNDAALYRTCGDLLVAQASREAGRWIPTAAIVSAAGGMTDALVSVITTAVHDRDAAAAQLRAAVARQVGITLELVPGRPELTDPVVASLESDGESVGSLLATMALMRGVPPQMLESWSLGSARSGPRRRSPRT